ncbi:MAG: hypothetical protein ACE5G2_08635, partial [Candidatus Krumholzibacteriia bacterium]
ITPVFDWRSAGRNNVARVRVSGAVGPRLTVQEEFLGTHTFVGGSRPVRLDIAAGQPITFTWFADATEYGGEIVAYRFGWNIRNPENDQEWSSWSLSNRSAPPRTFNSGSHRFFLQARDNAEVITSAIIELTIHQVTLLRDVVWIDDTQEVVPGSGQEIQEDDRWLQVLSEVADEHGLMFDPGRDVFDIVKNRGEAPPIETIFDYKAVVWSARKRDSSALQELTRFFDPFVPRNRNTVRSFNYMNIYLANGGTLWINGDRPARDMWPEEHRALPHPINVTNWDDPIEPHPFIDSVGTTSLLYNMGIEIFDVGAGTGFARNGGPQFCRGFERAQPQGFEMQTTESSEVLDHTHTIDILTDDVESPPAGGVTVQTSVEFDHMHTVHVSEEDFSELMAGNTVELVSSEEGQPQPHTHVFELVDQLGLWGAPALSTSGSWNVPGTTGRNMIGIFNMPNAMAQQTPPLLPLDGISVVLYTYMGKPEDREAGFFYPETADKQPTFILAKGSIRDRFYSRAFCGFEPYLLSSISHKRLLEFILVRHFRLGQPVAN